LSPKTTSNENNEFDLLRISIELHTPIDINSSNEPDTYNTLSPFSYISESQKVNLMTKITNQTRMITYRHLMI